MPSHYIIFLVRPLLLARCRFWSSLLRPTIPIDTHTHTHTLSRTPLEEAYTCTTHNIRKRQTSMPWAGFEPTVPKSELPQSCAIDRTPTGIGRGQLKCDGTRAETRFHLSAKRTSPFKSALGVSSVDYWQPSCAHQR